jgi:hypothetical protein
MRRLRAPSSPVERDVEVLRTAVGLVVRTMVVSAEAEGQHRLLRVERAIAVVDVAGESEDRDRKCQTPQRVQVVGRDFRRRCVRA